VEIGRRGFLFGTLGAIIIPAFIPVVRAAEIIKPISIPIKTSSDWGMEINIAGIVTGEPTPLPMSSLYKGLTPSSYTLRHEWDHEEYNTLYGGTQRVMINPIPRVSFEATVLSNNIHNLYADGHEIMLYLPGEDCILEYPCVVNSLEISSLYDKMYKRT